MPSLSDPQGWKTVESHTAFQNRWISVLVDSVVLPGGATYKYTRLAPAGIGVGVIGFNEQGEVLMEREYRHGVGEVIWQLPGGLAAEYENLEEAGLRELLEETGYAPHLVTAQTVRYLGAVWDNPAFGVGQSHVFAVWGLRSAEQPSRDPEEYVTLHWRSLAWLKESVRTGAIKDRVVVAALAYLLLNGWAV